VPVIPIFINVFTPPTPSMARAHDLGMAVASATATWPERVLVIGTGGLSHSPLYWDEGSPDTEFFRRMRRFQDGGLDYLAADPGLFTELGEREIALGKAGVTSINQAWDREFLAALQAGDAGFVRGLQVDEMTKVAGAGAREALTWAAVMGAMGTSVPDIVGYEPVEPWITGVGFAAYPVVTASGPDAG
jgi:2,3-dihydroxyphenylpropionate 1,2-dioxygenase